MNPKLFPYDEEVQRQFPVQVAFVKVIGLEHTSQKLVDRLFEPAHQCASLHDLNDCLMTALRRLDSLDIVSDVTVDLDIRRHAEGSPQPDAGAPNELLVLLRMKEKKRLTASVGASVTTSNDVDIHTSVGLRNILGIADHMAASVSYFGGKSVSLKCNAFVPDVMGGYWERLGAEAELWSRRGVEGWGGAVRKWASGAKLQAQVSKEMGVSVGFEDRIVRVVEKQPEEGEQGGTDLAGLRRLFHEEGVLPRKVVAFLSHSLVLRPLTALRLRLKNTIGQNLYDRDDSYYRMHFLTSVRKSFFRRYVRTNLALQVGWVHTLFPSKDPRQIDLLDRVYAKTRGFPISKRRGRLAVSIMASIGFPLRFLGDFYNATKAHVMGFIDCGGILLPGGGGPSPARGPQGGLILTGDVSDEKGDPEADDDDDGELETETREWASDLRQLMRRTMNVSCGVGLHGFFQPGRVEMNLCWPLWVAQSGSDNSFTKLEFNFVVD